MPQNYWWLILYLATLCTSIGYAIWFVVIHETDVNVVALTIFAQPIAGVAIAALCCTSRCTWANSGAVWPSSLPDLGLSRQIKTAE